MKVAIPFFLGGGGGGGREGGKGGKSKPCKAPPPLNY